MFVIKDIQASCAFAWRNAPRLMFGCDPESTSGQSTLMSGTKAKSSQASQMPQPSMESRDSFADKRSNDWMFQKKDQENDYTTGPARLVEAHDGSKACPAILLSWELADKLQSTINAKRDAEFFSVQLEKHRASVHEEEQEIDSREIECASKLDRLEQMIVKRGDRPSQRQEQQRTELRATLGKCASARDALQAEEQGILQHLETAEQFMAEFQRGSFLILEDVCMKANLMEYFDPYTFSSVDNQDAVQDVLENIPANETVDHVVSEDGHFGTDESMGPQLSHEQSQILPNHHAQAEAKQLRARRTQGVWYAQHEHQEHSGSYQYRLWQYISTQVNRPNVDFKAEYDLIHLQEGQRLTRKFLDAEQALELARYQAKNAGVVADDEQSSMFTGEPSCDNLEFDDPIPELDKVFVDFVRIQNWLKDTESIGELPWQGLDNEQCQETSISRCGSQVSLVPKRDRSVTSDEDFYDSVSAVDETKRRRKIKSWAEVVRKGYQ